MVKKKKKSQKKKKYLLKIIIFIARCANTDKSENRTKENFVSKKYVSMSGACMAYYSI